MIEIADQILTVLQNDQTFMSHIGSYTFEAGQVADAVVILAANEQLPALSKVEGLEAVISRMPDLSSRPTLSDCTILEKTWRIYLVEYDGANPNDCVYAADRICALFPGARYGVSYNASNLAELAGNQQVVVTLPPHATVSEIAGQLQPDGNLEVDGGASCD